MSSSSEISPKVSLSWHLHIGCMLSTCCLHIIRRTFQPQKYFQLNSRATALLKTRKLRKSLDSSLNGRACRLSLPFVVGHFGSHPDSRCFDIKFSENLQWKSYYDWLDSLLSLITIGWILLHLFKEPYVNVIWVILYLCNRSCGKVMFLQACIIPSVHKGRAWWKGCAECRWNAWQRGVCVANEGGVWGMGVCMPGGACMEEGVCMGESGMHGGGNAW